MHVFSPCLPSVWAVESSSTQPALRLCREVPSDSVTSPPTSTSLKDRTPVIAGFAESVSQSDTSNMHVAGNSANRPQHPTFRGRAAITRLYRPTSFPIQPIKRSSLNRVVMRPVSYGNAVKNSRKEPVKAVILTEPVQAPHVIVAQCGDASLYASAGCSSEIQC